MAKIAAAVAATNEAVNELRRLGYPVRAMRSARQPGIYVIMISDKDLPLIDINQARLEGRKVEEYVKI
jgi:hypothetical protein